jgi:hypothetical protein
MLILRCRKNRERKHLRMPRIHSTRSFDARLYSAVTQHINKLVVEIEAAVRQNIAFELAAFTGTAVARTPRGRATSKPRDMRCLAPGCPNTSRGPRFRYLCTKHDKATDKQVAAWREARKAEKGGTKRLLPPAAAAPRRASNGKPSAKAKA